MKTLAQIKAEKQSKAPVPTKSVPENLRVKYKEKRNVFEDTQAEIAVLKEAFKDPLQKEREQKEKLTDGNFWFAVYFKSKEQKEEFLKKSGASKITSGIYIDGVQLADIIGVQLQETPPLQKPELKKFKE